MGINLNDSMVKTYLYCIAYGCPKQKRDKYCPFYKIDHFLFEEKIIWINNLNAESVDSFFRYHIYCSKSKSWGCLENTINSILEFYHSIDVINNWIDKQYERFWIIL